MTLNSDKKIEYFVEWESLFILSVTLKGPYCAFYSFPFPAVYTIGFSACKWSAKAIIPVFPSEGVPLPIKPYIVVPYFWNTTLMSLCIDTRVFLYLIKTDAFIVFFRKFDIYFVVKNLHICTPDVSINMSFWLLICILLYNEATVTKPNSPK